MILRAVLLLMLPALLLQAAITLSQIESKPTSRARDFLIWEFLRQQDVDKESAKKAFALVKEKSNLKLKKAYAKIVDDDVRKELVCKKRKDLLTIEDQNCLRAAFSLYKTLHYSRFQRDELIARGLDTKQITLLALQNEPYSFKYYQTYDPKLVIDYISSIPKQTLRSKLNETLSSKNLKFLLSASNFGSFVSLVVTDYELENLQRSLLNLDGKKLNAYTDFLLGLNALRHNDRKNAVKFLKLAQTKAKHPRERDKADFWLYLTTKDRSYLETLLLSMSINIYTLYAHEKMGVDVENYFSEMKVSDEVSSYDLRDPFDWLQILQEIKSTNKTKLFELIDRYRYKDLLPVQRYVTERAFDFKMHGYIMPYERYLQERSKSEKALIYSIMRRESNYIPGALSHSYALGLMQLMPFLVDHIAKKQDEKIERYSEMFEPEKNLKYAWIHLRWLKKVLDDNPLYIAYAYNGGYGFFTRYKKSGRFGKGEFEPFMSMEMMRNSESREYAKRVLANYVMYKKIYKEPFSLVTFLQTLK